MRVFILNTYPIWGGDEKWTINVGKGLRDKGHHVVISSQAGSKTENEAKKSNLITFPFSVGPDIAIWKIPPLRKYLKNNNIDVALCVQNRDVKIGALAARLAKVPVVLARQGLDTIKKKLDHKLVFTNFVDGIITNTISLKNLYEGYGWFPENFVHVVNDGLTLPCQIPTLDLHSIYNLCPQSKIIIGTGRLVQQKRFDLLLEVAYKAKQNQQNWSFIIAGEGELKPMLEKMISKFDLEQSVRLVGFREDILSLMNSSDLFLLSSDNEGMSNALREAMALGLPCVATDVFGVSELFGNNENGLIVKKGNSEEMFSSIEAIFESDELTRKLRNNAIAKIQDAYTMDNMINQIESIFENRLRKVKT